MQAFMRGQKRTYHCSFCGKDQDSVQRLIAGPGGVYVCDECVTVAKQDTWSRVAENMHCSFCGKTQTQVSYMVPGPKSVCICSECVDLCLEIIVEESK